jgi:outer membrane protein FlgP
LPAFSPSSFLPAVFMLAACAVSPPTARQALPLNAMAETRLLAGVKDDLDAVTAARMAPPARQVPMLHGIGFAQIAGQPGKTANEKRLMAIRAARVDALRDLTEQVHGIHLTSDTTIKDAVVRNDSLRALVDGTLRGAQTLRVTPKGSDSYEVEMTLDRDTVAYVLRAVRGGA